MVRGRSGGFCMAESKWSVERKRKTLMSTICLEEKVVLLVAAVEHTRKNAQGHSGENTSISVGSCGLHKDSTMGIQRERERSV